MEALATPRVAPAWVCPECGHGSPEPRDRLAHLDAHRQLKRFLDDWDAAAKADAAAEAAAARRRRRRPYVYGAVAALVLLLLAAVAIRLAGGAPDQGPAARGPVPAVELPGYDLLPAPEPAPVPPGEVPPAAPAVPGNGTGQARPVVPAPEPAGAPVGAVPDRPADDRSVVPPVATTPAVPVSTVAGAGVPTTPSPPPPPARPGLMLNLCLLDICVATTS